MRFIKNGILIIVVLYLFSFSIVWFHSKNHLSGNTIDLIFKTTKLNYVWTVLRNKTNLLPKVYSFFNYQNYFKKKEHDIKFIFSKEDIKFNDSIIESAIKSGFFPDSLKSWRNAQLIYKGEIRDIKYKFHGSSISSYRKGFRSYKIKASDKIFGRNTFTLINGLEMQYEQIFFNLLGRNEGLFSEDYGQIIKGYDYLSTDFYLYNTFNDVFFNNTYKKLLKYKFKKSFNSKYSFADRTDKFHYSLDESFNFNENGLGSSLNKYRDIHSGTYKFNEFEKKYLANYMALIYLFRDEHQILGYNSIWLSVDDYLVPKYRNEGVLSILPSDPNDLDNSIFMDYPTYKSHIFQKLIINNEIRNLRNKAIYRMLKKEKVVINTLDSIYEKYKNIHVLYNPMSFYVTNQHKVFKSNLKSNFNALRDYLSVNEVFINRTRDSIKLISDSFSNLKLILNDSAEFIIEPRGFYLKGDHIVNDIVENKFLFKKKIEKIILLNKTTGDTISKNKIIIINE